MWYGKGSYEFFDKDALRSFSCYENTVLDNDVTRITLYENILDYKKQENRDIQWEFRNKLHVDEIAEKLQEEAAEEFKKNADPEIEIKEGRFEHGGVRLIREYLKDGKSVRRSRADSVKITELDEDGKEVYNERKREERI
jgi:argonaute-like protein implicated in RNA metabolism and viral defense